MATSRIILAAISLALACTGITRAQTLPSTPGTALLERGRYLVEIAAYCAACHGTRGLDGRIVVGMELAGGRVMSERGFRAVAPNITPDPETGVGRWTDSELATAIREGRRPDNSRIGPPMPVELYRGLSNTDVSAMVAYLRSVPAIRHAVVERSTYPFTLAPSGPPAARVPDPPSNNAVARGAYLAGPVAHCMDCHTPPLQNEGRDWSRIGAGGVPFEGPWGMVVGANITSDLEQGIGRWSDEQILRAITQGISADGRRLAPPMSGRAPIWARLTESDKQDLVAYLRSLSPQPSRTR
ncbi:c-type cytochrome [Paracraurococcus lichenis]|uniref:C-type cytochrome n=1 Tax=Paracraurococcus lichenis TaxID=3064888 RepID=A0ABT9E985_9PROT|nr:c-type cytochrome [Paracraurococcus sp. LOR1-02]MDO9712753.1 c-type cytochrome [Paracraurococcus sp. LOR1-02]